MRTSFLNIIATKKATQAPNSLASASIVCNFVNQIRQVRERPTFCKRSSAPPSKIFGQQTTALISSTYQQRMVVVSIWSTATFLGQPSAQSRLSLRTKAPYSANHERSASRTLSASLQIPWPADESTNFLQHVRANDFDPANDLAAPTDALLDQCKSAVPQPP